MALSETKSSSSRMAVTVVLAAIVRSVLAARLVAVTATGSFAPIIAPSIEPPFTSMAVIGAVPSTFSMASLILVRIERPPSPLLKVAMFYLPSRMIAP